MNGFTAILIIGIGLILTLLIGIAAQVRGRRLLLVAHPAPPAMPPPDPRLERLDDMDALSSAIEDSRRELQWLHEQIDRERVRLSGMRRQTPAAEAPAPPTARPLSPESPYSILGLAPDASAADIRRRYRLLSRVWHPDRFVDGPEELRVEAELMMGRLNRAHNALTSQGGGLRR